MKPWELMLGKIIPYITVGYVQFTLGLLIGRFVFPRKAMPTFFRLIVDVLPLTWFLQITRDIMLKGIGIGYLWPQPRALLVLILFFLSVSLVKFGKTLD